jgi:hypothetical protein
MFSLRLKVESTLFSGVGGLGQKSSEAPLLFPGLSPTDTWLYQRNRPCIYLENQGAQNVFVRRIRVGILATLLFKIFLRNKP